ncbi:MAG: PepSY domain-containing protein [Gammaproteobacteria bacterium]|nr:PepSY domain-containing protein [Gammaproteobacteria bacterium]
MTRWLFLIHRYLGMAVGAVISLWCLSGFVMMYEQYPELDDNERLAGLERLNLTDCCRLPAGVSNINVDSFRLEMMAGTPVLRLMAGRRQQVIDLHQGEHLSEFGAVDARFVANTAATEYGLQGVPRLVDVRERDQWTVYASYHPHRPLFHFAMEDRAGTEFYVSSTSGEVVQMTTSRQRFLNWMGAVIHWLYPTALRQHTGVWLQVVIWLTIVSLFLTVVGVYIGLKQFKTRRNGSRSPYRGWALWHHYAGLVFGLFALTWLTSGLFSVSPFGALEGRNFNAEMQRLRGGAMSVDDASAFVRALSGSQIPSSTVRLDVSMVEGHLYAVALDEDAQRLRLNAGTLIAEKLSAGFFARVANILRPDVPVTEASWLTEDDAYYFSHHEKRRFPVFRIRYGDGERFYLDSVTGEIAHAVDRDRRWSRWIFHALHRGDFSALVRSRPIWDLMMWPLMLGVSICALTGTWLGFRRLAKAVRRHLHRARWLNWRQRPRSREAKGFSISTLQ